MFDIPEITNHREKKNKNLYSIFLQKETRFFSAILLCHRIMQITCYLRFSAFNKYKKKKLNTQDYN